MPGKGAKSAAYYSNASSRRIDLPQGLGSRHIAAASITGDTDAVATVMSQSSVVGIFNSGQLISEIIPEVWLFGNETLRLPVDGKNNKWLTCAG